MAAKDDISVMAYGHIPSATAVSPLHSEELLFPHVEDSCEITMACYRADYSASRIARAVEDCDAHLLNLNVTSQPLDGGEMTVMLRVGMRNPMAVARSLERYGYRVVEIHSGTENDAAVDVTRERLGELMAHINI
ncbi:MAG: hypothetical protein NC043_01135 [Muribaculaceae bacterium]|nr:hypothetical protein [Muribaculaceae bacterium]